VDQGLDATPQSPNQRTTGSESTRINPKPATPHKDSQSPLKPSMSTLLVTIFCVFVALVSGQTYNAVSWSVQACFRSALGTMLNAPVWQRLCGRKDRRSLLLPYWGLLQQWFLVVSVCSSTQGRSRLTALRRYSCDASGIPTNTSFTDARCTAGAVPVVLPQNCQARRPRLPTARSLTCSAEQQLVWVLLRLLCWLAEPACW